MARNYKSVKGFTLLELLVALAIVGILASIALPSYSSAMQNTRRSVAMAELQSLTLFMERVYGENMSYAPGGSAPTLPFTVSPKTGGDEFYDLTVASSATTYTLTATPKNAQSGDRCGALSIDYLGNLSASQSDCW
jgi:type IV pilus assembly protein PilE